ncbi:MAG: ribonuclease III [Bacilli bacterium]|nr:ribonuclease III [Bacilli bacterium]
MKEFLKGLNIETNNLDLYIQAVTHPSYANEHGEDCKHLERLEFMGDAVLQLMVSHLIYYKEGSFLEGEMSLIRSKLVRADSLCNEAKKLGLDKVLNLGVGEEKSGGRNGKNILADAFEAFVAAIYLDKGFDFTFEFVKSVFSKLVDEIDVASLLDYKSKLQELVQADTKQSVSYREVSHSGTSNNPIYVFEVLLDDEIVLATGTGKSKKLAQQDAAKNALEKCSK